MSKLLILLFLVGCSTVTPEQKPCRFAKIDKRLVQYVKAFEGYRGEKIPVGTEMVLENIKEKKAGGYFHRVENKTYINKRRFDKGSHMFREMVIFHELGHHVLKRHHSADEFYKTKDSCPKSMMYWSISEQCYRLHRIDYLLELFSEEVSLWTDTFKKDK